jgi:hypothetical protein
MKKRQTKGLFLIVGGLIFHLLFSYLLEKSISTMIYRIYNFKFISPILALTMIGFGIAAIIKKDAPEGNSKISVRLLISIANMDILAFFLMVAPSLLFNVAMSNELLMSAVLSHESGKFGKFEILLMLAYALPFVGAISIVAFWISYKKDANKVWLFFSLLPWAITLLLAFLIFIWYF